MLPPPRRLLPSALRLLVVACALVLAACRVDSSLPDGGLTPGPTPMPPRTDAGVDGGADGGRDAGVDGGSDGGFAGDGGDYGVPTESGLPDARERALWVLANAVRLSPQAYRDRYMADFRPSPTNILTAYTAVPPLGFDAALARVARSHAQDMAGNCGLQHDSCDGTPVFTRLRAAYDGGEPLGENIAAGQPEPRDVLNAWLCDQQAGAGFCCPDGQACDGHRRNLMSSGFGELGVGTAPSADAFGRYWVQDFGGGAAELPAALVAGAHIRGLTAGTTTFLANARDPGGSPRQLRLVYDADTRVDLALELGSPALGTWSITLPASDGCRAYHFEAVDSAGRASRFPARGRFQEGPLCARDWVP